MIIPVTSSVKNGTLISNQSQVIIMFVTFLVFWGFFCVALHPKSTAMVMGGWSVHLITLFHGQA